MIRSRLIVLACLLMFGATLAVWANGSQQTSTSPSATHKATITWWSPNFEDPMNTALAKKYEAHNPNVKVNVDTTVATGLKNKILVALQSGSVPNVIDVQVGWNVPYAATGTLLALNQYVANSKVVKPSDFFSANWNSVKYEGKIYGIPYRAGAHAFFYNKSMYSAAGLNPNSAPATWQQLINYSKKLTHSSGNNPTYGIGIVGGGEVGNMIYDAVPYIWMNGGRVLTANDKKAVINKKAAVQAIKFYTDLYTKYHVVPPSVLGNDGVSNRNLFAQQKIAQYQSGIYDIPPLKKAAPNLKIGFGLIPHPRGAKTSAVLGGWNFVIPKAASNKNATWDFVQYLSEPANMAYYTDTFPATSTALKNKRFHQPQDKYFAEMLKYTRLTPSVKGWVQMESIIQKSVQSILLGNATAQQAMNAAASKMQGLLQQ